MIELWLWCRNVCSATFGFVAVEVQRDTHSLSPSSGAENNPACLYLLTVFVFSDGVFFPPWILLGKTCFPEIIFPALFYFYIVFCHLIFPPLVWFICIQLLDLPCLLLKDDICLSVRRADGQYTLSSVLLSGVWHKRATGHGNQTRLTSTPRPSC